MTDRPKTASDRTTKLTRRQRQVLAALHRLHARHGYAPTLRELADELELASPSTVLVHVRALERAGLIERRAGQPRTARLTQA
ncbi:MAG: MarR family transcriptional regulator [Actinobacteria bacterium]|jgi:repressor LexA|nr:MarR family transcriptional regulator [Actinomycetota bacterium]